jgi:hypothetical protein
MRRILRLSWLLVRGLLGVIFVLGVIETALGAPSAIKWLKDAGVTHSQTLGLVLAVVVSFIFGLTALGPERVKHWLALARGQDEPPPLVPPNAEPQKSEPEPPSNPMSRESAIMNPRLRQLHDRHKMETPLDLKRLLREGLRLKGVLDATGENIPLLKEDPIYHWAKATWEALEVDKPMTAKEFFGDKSPYGGPWFGTAYGLEIDRIGRRAYLDSRIQILAEVVESASGTPTQRREEPPISDADRNRILGETEQRLARSIHDPTLRSLNESNKQQSAEEVDGMTVKAGRQEAERLAVLYHESKQLRQSLSIGRIAVLAGAINGTSEPTQIQLEQRVRAWDMRVEILLSAGERQRWAQSTALPPNHPTRSLIEPSISIEGLIRFVDQKRACLKEIIERMGDDK